MVTDREIVIQYDEEGVSENVKNVDKGRQEEGLKCTVLVRNNCDMTGKEYRKERQTEMDNRSDN